MIVEVNTFAPGDYISPCNHYKTKQNRTVFFLTDYEVAQFVEVNNQLTTNWKAGDSVTSKLGDEYCIMNLSLKPFVLLSVFHDDESGRLLEKAKEAVACMIS